MNREQIKKVMNQQYAAIASDESRLANELQAQFPNTTRTHCLKEAARLVGIYGIGCSLSK
jgi:hypothetical protein